LVLTKQYQNSWNNNNGKSKTTIPNWFWAVAVFSLLWIWWRLLFQQITMTDEALKSLPSWTRVVQQLSALDIHCLSHLRFGGIIGSIGLLMKKNGQNLHLLFALAIIIQMIHSFFLQKPGSLWCWHRSHAYTNCLCFFSVMVFYFELRKVAKINNNLISRWSG
jgi:hypothetical protein